MIREVLLNLLIRFENVDRQNDQALVGEFPSYVVDGRCVPDSSSLFTMSGAPHLILRDKLTCYVPAGTQTLSAATISAFGTSVMKLTRWRPGFFFGMA
jgi:hypothetical protein